MFWEGVLEVGNGWVNGIDEEECVKERGKERYFCKAGVMSRNEGEEGEELFA